MPIAFIPKNFVLQPVETSEVADELATLVDEPSFGLQPDLAGPEIRSATHLAKVLMAARGRKGPTVNLPVFGKAASAFREGNHTNADRAVRSRTWEDFVSRTG